ncbi:MAG: carbohydrate-binding domain-containing protein [Bacteroidales bacterium]|nr:carbohydrate-binding domain-containing protein [Bacteroidales bacterium]
MQKLNRIFQKQGFVFFVFFALLFVMACNKNEETETESNIHNVEMFDGTVADALSQNTSGHEEEGDYSWDQASETVVLLKGDSASCTGAGVIVSDSSRILINASGNYRFSGGLNDGQIIVNTNDGGIVRLIFNGINIHNENTAPIYVKGAGKTIVYLIENTENFLSDGSTYIFEDPSSGEPNATLFSKDNLSIAGEGSLQIDANYNDAIMGKDGLIIRGSKINITSVDDGIRGKDYVIIKDAELDINATGDGIKSDNDEDVTKAYINIDGGTYNISSGTDAIQAKTDLLISSGEFNITSGGGSNQILESDETAKGLKSSVLSIIEDGTFNINSADDAIHTNNQIVINNGNFEISSGDDGIHADSLLGIHGGTINITNSYEGIESMNMLISGGDIKIVSNDDGLNCAGGVDNSGMGGWQPPGNSSSDFFLWITGGSIAIYASGDGIDVNGWIEMTGGTVIVHGPTSNGNGAMDYDSTFNISGGLLIAVGSSGMAQATSTNSSQNAVLINLSSVKQAGTLIHIQDEDGNALVTFSPSKAYQSILYSSSSLKTGETYEYYSGGSSTGTSLDGLFSSGVYTDGSLYTSFKISSVVTRAGSSSSPH